MDQFINKNKQLGAEKMKLCYKQNLTIFSKQLKRGYRKSPINFYIDPLIH